jgi:hypothetical protein
MVAPRKSKNIFRTLFFITVPLILIGATVLVIIISQGSSVTTGGIVGNTGVVRINIDPENLVYELYIDGTIVENLNNKGANLEAGEHSIRVESAGMTTWEKTVTITKGVVNEVYVKLFPENMALVQLTTTNIQHAFMSTAGDYIFYVVTGATNASENGIWKMQLSSNAIIFLDKSYSITKVSDFTTTMQTIVTSNNYKLIPSPDNTKVLLIDNDSKQTLVVNTQGTNTEPQVTDIGNVVGFSPADTNWYSDSNTLLVRDVYAIFTYNLSSNIATLIKYSPTTEIPYGANKEQVVYFDNTTKTIQIFGSNNSTTLSLKGVSLPTNITAVYIPSDSNHFIVIKTLTNYQLIDLEKSTLTSMATADSTLELQSPDGLGYVFKATDGTLTAYTFTENVGLDSLEMQKNRLDISLNENDRLIFTTQSSYLLYFNAADSTLYTLDWDGTNKLILVQGQTISGMYNFDESASNLIITLKDGTLSTNNIYRLSLVKTN